MIILDTDVLSLLFRGSGHEYETLLARLTTSGESLSTTIITFEEQMRGWLGFVAKRRDPDDLAVGYKRLHSLLDDFGRIPVVEFDDASATVLNQLRRAKTRIGEMDLRIAAIALSRDATLITRNTRDFHRVPGLRIEDWTAEHRR